MPLPAIAGVYCSFVLLILYVVAPAVPLSRAWLQRLTTPWAWIAIWCLPYFIYAAGTGDFRLLALLKLLLISVPLLAIYKGLPVSDGSQFCWQDAIVALVLICAVLFHGLSGIWTVPLNLDFMARLYVVAVASWCWTMLRVVPDLGYRFQLSTRVFRAAALNFVYFAAIALPAGFATRFIRWNPHWRGPVDFCLQFLEIFLFIAVLEELFFRGFLQSLLSARWRSWWLGQLCVSCLFGLFHILHAPFPNWRYVALASVAGWFYGSAFRQGGNLAASSLTHALVDTAWRTWFSALP